MGNGMNKILPGLYLGNFIDAKDLDQLSKNSITHIVSIHESPQPFIPERSPGRSEDRGGLQRVAQASPKLPQAPGITYLRITLPDIPEANIKKHFKECIHFIHSCRLRGGNCLVHCLAGISRSTTIVLAYIIAVTQLSWREALEAVKEVRPVANPNPGFRQQLEEYGGSRSAQKIHRRLERKYGAAPFDDEEEIRALLPAGKRRDTARPWQTLAPESRGPKQADPFLLRVKQTFSCLPRCLK